MPAARLLEIAKYCDRILRTTEIKDYDGAHNGLQVENSGMITRIAAAVDASPATVRLAAEIRANLLIVHHGLFWSARHPWTRSNYRLFRALLDNDLAVYSSHLPLDVHPELGNNARLCEALGLRNLQPFFTGSRHANGQPLGFRAQASLSRDEIKRRLKLILGSAPLVIPGGPETCRRVGVVTGGAGSELEKAA